MDEIFDLIDCDLWGPYSTSSITNARYFLSMVDDKSMSVWVYLLKEKSETIDFLINFHKSIRTQFGNCIKIIRSDHGKECVSSRANHFYYYNGIIHHMSGIDTP